ncbi:MAG: sortase [Candidatus Shapirobacteria bacterium]|jgi:LPXTG-site transpeptidase (sortase) family protein
MHNLFEITPIKRSVKIKNKKGVVYSNPTGIKRWFFYVGTGIVLISIVYLGYLYQPLAYSWLVYRGLLKNNNPIVVEENKTNEVVSDEFSIRIPKIGAQSKIIANVSPYNPDEYLKVLENDLIAQSKTSSIPGSGKGKTTYLFAHSTQQSLQMVRKNSVFYLLGELDKENLILIKYRGKNLAYKVYEKKIVNAKEINYLEYTDKDKEILILQTCWPLGTNWQRLLIFAERV